MSIPSIIISLQNTSCCLCSSLVAWSAEEKRRKARSERGEPRSESFQSVRTTFNKIFLLFSDDFYYKVSGHRIILCGEFFRNLKESVNLMFKIETVLFNLTLSSLTKRFSIPGLPCVMQTCRQDHINTLVNLPKIKTKDHHKVTSSLSWPSFTNKNNNIHLILIATIIFPLPSLFS